MTDDALTNESTIYVAYIAAAAEQVWSGLTARESTRQYFFGRDVESDWQAGAAWRLRRADGVIDVEGTVLECDPPRKLVLSWRVKGLPAPQELPECIVTYQIDSLSDGVVRLTMIESHPTAIPARLLEGGRTGWPMILSGLKTLLETGRPLPLPTPQAPQ